jgi:hypothetical protein
MVGLLQIPEVPEAERTPAVLALIEVSCKLREALQALQDEIARLKGLNPRPTIRPSRLEKDTPKKDKHPSDGKRPGSAKRHKTKELIIHETKLIQPHTIPPGSRPNGYEDFTQQELTIEPHNTLYRRQRWVTPDGDELIGSLPPEASTGHFGSRLVAFIQYQYHHAGVTQPLLLEQLWEWGIDISAGQINRIVTEGKDGFHEEKATILPAGIEVSSYIHVDDTSARHEGRNGYCTHIGNELFAWFESTESKSRINFLTLLRGRYQDYVLNGPALDYLREQKLPKCQVIKLAMYHQACLTDECSWESALEELGIKDERHVRIATEGALLGSVLTHGLSTDFMIISDDAGQFNVLRHALCWIHAERTLAKLIGFNDDQRAALAQIRTAVWDFYAVLKAYKEAPNEEDKGALSQRFDEIFTTKTCFTSLDLALGRLRRNKAELLLVLEHPELPLHNNLSERDIREYVKKRKISGSTRSDAGRRCRDTFTSLKKTCRKLGVSFWEYLLDRVRGTGAIPPLAELIRRHAQPALVNAAANV